MTPSPKIEKRKAVAKKIEPGVNAHDIYYSSSEIAPHNPGSILESGITIQLDTFSSRGVKPQRARTALLWQRILKRFSLVLRITAMRYRLEVALNAKVWEDLIEHTQGREGEREGEGGEEGERETADNVKSRRKRSVYSLTNSKKGANGVNKELYEQKLATGANAVRHYEAFNAIRNFIVPVELHSVEEETVSQGIVNLPDDNFMALLSSCHVFSEKESSGSKRITTGTPNSPNTLAITTDQDNQSSSIIQGHLTSSYANKSKTNNNNDDDMKNDDDCDRNTMSACKSSGVHRNKSADFSSTRDKSNRARERERDRQGLTDLRKCQSDFTLSSSGAECDASRDDAGMKNAASNHSRDDSDDSDDEDDEEDDDDEQHRAVAPFTVLSTPCDTIATVEQHTALNISHVDYETDTTKETDVQLHVEITPTTHQHDSIEKEEVGSTYGACNTPTAAKSVRERRREKRGKEMEGGGEMKVHDSDARRESIRMNAITMTQINDEINKEMNCEIKRQIDIDLNNQVRRESLRCVNLKMLRLADMGERQSDSNSGVSEISGLEAKAAYEDLNKVASNSKQRARDAARSRGGTPCRGGERSRSLPEIRSTPCSPSISPSCTGVVSVVSGSSSLVSTVRCRAASQPFAMESSSFESRGAVKRGSQSSTRVGGIAALGKTVTSSINCKALEGIDRNTVKDSKHQSSLFFPAPTSSVQLHHTHIPSLATLHVLDPKSSRLRPINRACDSNSNRPSSPFNSILITSQGNKGTSPSAVDALSQPSIDSIVSRRSSTGTGAGSASGRRRSISPTRRSSTKIDKVKKTKESGCSDMSGDVLPADKVTKGAGYRKKMEDIAATDSDAWKGMHAKDTLSEIKLDRGQGREKGRGLGAASDVSRSTLLAALKVGLPSRLWKMIPVTTSGMENETNGNGSAVYTGKKGKLKGVRGSVGGVCPVLGDDLEGEEYGDGVTTCLGSSCLNTARSASLPLSLSATLSHSQSRFSPVDAVREKGRQESQSRKGKDEEMVKHFLELTEDSCQ